MGETLEQRALRIASDLESRDVEAAEVLRALVCGNDDMKQDIRTIGLLASSLAAAFRAVLEPTTPAPRVRGDSRTDDAGRWQGLESGVET